MARFRCMAFSAEGQSLNYCEAAVSIVDLAMQVVLDWQFCERRGFFVRPSWDASNDRDFSIALLRRIPGYTPRKLHRLRFRRAEYYRWSRDFSQCTMLVDQLFPEPMVSTKHD